MSELLTAAQMRAIEQAAIESGEVTGLELMERAGRGVVEAIFEEWPELGEEGGATPHPAEPDSPRGNSGTEKRAVVLCGPGNNGGDGFVVARLLKERGWEVEVFLYGDAEKSPPDARANYERWLEIGEVVPYKDAVFEDDENAFATADLIVDAFLGTGQTRAASFCATMMHVIEDIVVYHEGTAKVVSIDLPTGLDADSGKVFPIDGAAAPHVILPHLTVSFHCAKLGHHLAYGPKACGKLVVKDIGL